MTRGVLALFSNVFKTLKDKNRRERGDSLVSAVIVLPLIIAILFTIVDFSVFSVNRSIVQQASRDAARTVAIYGGAGTRGTATTIENAYGNNRACATTEANASRAGSGFAFAKAYSSSSTPIECALMNTLEENVSLVNVEFEKVKCTPAFTTSVGQEVSCTVDWSYNGIPASGLTLLGMVKNSDGSQGRRLGLHSRSIGTARSEVKFEGSDLVRRR